MLTVNQTVERMRKSGFRIGSDRFCYAMRKGVFPFAVAIPPAKEKGKWVYYISEDKLNDFLKEWNGEEEKISV